MYKNFIQMNENQQINLGKKVRKYREIMGFSQTELAKEIHKSSAAYIAYIEAGKRNISTIDLMALANVLETTVSNLIGEKEITFQQALRNASDLNEEDKNHIALFHQFLKEKSKKNENDR